MTDPITETDLMGYVDDEIDMARRIAVEDYLAQTPEAAARVMADLRSRDALRLSFAPHLPRPAPATLDAARRLRRALVWRGAALRLRKIAAVVALVSFGWFAHGQVGLGISDSEASPKPPAFVEDALHAHETALLRARMASQPEAAGYDSAEILAATGIRLPVLPGEWRVLDAQLFPSREGHSVEMVVEAADLGRVSLFAAQVPASDGIAPTVARFGSNQAIYWQTGGLAFALTGSGSEKALERAAIRLSRTLR